MWSYIHDYGIYKPTDYHLRKGDLSVFASLKALKTSTKPISNVVSDSAWKTTCCMEAVSWRGPVVVGIIGGAVDSHVVTWVGGAMMGGAPGIGGMAWLTATVIDEIGAIRGGCCCCSWAFLFCALITETIQKQNTEIIL